MTERSTTTDPKPPTDPRPPCAKCGSTMHTTGYHDGGAPPEDAATSPEGHHEGGVSPTGYHDGGLVSPDFGKGISTPAKKAENVAEGYHDGGNPQR